MNFSFLIFFWDKLVWRKTFPLILSHKHRKIIKNKIDFFLNWKTLTFKTFNCNLNDFFLFFRYFSIHWNKMINYSLSVGWLKILIKIFKFFNIVNIIAPWKKLTVIFSEGDNVSNISTKPKFGSNWLILMEMIDHLTVKKIHIIDIFFFTQIFQIVDQWWSVFILTPSVLCNESRF